MDRRIKKIESGHFKVFRSLVEDIPDGEVLHRDEPDFVILGSRKKIIGVEFRQLFKPTDKGRTPEQALESETSDIAAMAQEYAELRGTPPVGVSLFFNYRQTQNKSERDKIARSIARLVQEKYPRDENGSVELEYGVAYSDDRLKVIDEIYIGRNQHAKHHYWRPEGAGWAMRDNVGLIQAAIDDKTGKISRYQKRCDECWLVLTSDALRPSGAIHANDATRAHRFNSPFARTYFLDLALRKLNQLISAPMDVAAP